MSFSGNMVIEMSRRVQKIISKKCLIVIPKSYREENEVGKGDWVVVWTGSLFMVVLPHWKLSAFMRHHEILLEALVSEEDPALTVHKLLRHCPEIEKELRGINEEQANTSPPAPVSACGQNGGVEKAHDLGPNTKEE